MPPTPRYRVDLDGREHVDCPQWAVRSGSRRRPKVVARCFTRGRAERIAALLNKQTKAKRRVGVTVDDIYRVEHVERQLGHPIRTLSVEKGSPS